MSRIGKQLITIPASVTVNQADGVLTVTGPLGTLTRPWPEVLHLKLEAGGATIELARSSADTRALWGTYAAHLKNMILGVTKGFEKKLIIEGVGYRAAVAGQKMTLNLGFSHPIEKPIPVGLKVAVEKGVISLAGHDKEELGQFAAEIRALKKPEPYKGKGIRYESEVIRRKEGKRVVS